MSDEAVGQMEYIKIEKKYYLVDGVGYTIKVKFKGEDEKRVVLIDAKATKKCVSATFRLVADIMDGKTKLLLQTLSIFDGILNPTSGEGKSNVKNNIVGKK
jgi:hypothetical protein